MERDTHFTALTLYYTNFNSHAHVERDWNSFQWDYIPVIISTHTLTWSVTTETEEEPAEEEFQLTRSRGA